MAQLSCGIVGLPNAGKSALFNALTQGGAEVASYPFCTIDPNVGVVPVHDPRLDRVAELVGVDSTIYHSVEYVDVAGLVKDASKGAGRGNQFLEHVRNCHALLHVVRCFDDPDVAHVHGSIDPVTDIRTVNMELMLADIETAGRAVERLRKAARREPEAKAAVDVLERVREQLDSEKPVRTLSLADDELKIADSFRFLTSKSVLYVANVNESDLPGIDVELVKTVAGCAESDGDAVIPICAKLEEDLASLDSDEAALFLDDMGLDGLGLQRVVRATRELLGLVSFFTFNEKETRAWTVREGTTAQAAAGCIHTDFADNFIRAEVTAFDDFAASGGEKGARDKGLTRIEGRDYIVQDADVIYFRIGP